MAYDFLDTDNQRINYGGTTIFDGLTELSFHGWLWCDNVAQDNSLMTKRQAANQFIMWEDTSVSQQLRCYYKSIDARSTASMVANKWHSCGCSLAFGAADPSFFAYLDGVQGSNTGDLSGQASWDATETADFLIGDEHGFSRNTDGKIQECAVWNAILTPADFRLLAQRISPKFIRPNDLIFYVSLKEGKYHDEISGIEGTLEGTLGPLPYNHLPMVEPPGLGRRAFVAAVGGTTRTVPQADLALSTAAPSLTVTANHFRTAPQTNLVIDTKTPTVDESHVQTVPQADLVIDGKTPAQTIATLRFPDQTDLVIDGKTPTVNETHNKEVPQANLAIDTKTPMAVENWLRFPPQVDLVLSTATPTVNETHNKEVPQADLTLSTAAPVPLIAWFRSIPQVDLVIDTKTPTTTVGEIQVDRTPPQADLTIDTKTPILFIEYYRAPGQANLVITTKTPTTNIKDTTWRALTDPGPNWAAASEPSAAWSPTTDPGSNWAANSDPGSNWSDSTDPGPNWSPNTVPDC